MYAFKFIKAHSIAQALQLLHHDENAKIIAGGMTLIPTMKQRLASPTSLIDLSAIPDLHHIQLHDRFIEIGSLCTHDQVSKSSLILEHLPTLAKLASMIADPQVRFKGTLGGSLANNDPAADYPAAVLGMGGTIKTNVREIKADDFFQGMFTTALHMDEIILSIRFPLGQRASYQKFRHPSSGYALCGVWVSSSANEKRVAITGVYPCVRRWPQAEDHLLQNKSAPSFESTPIDLENILATHDASAHYKAQLMRVLCSRATQEVMP